jgi:(1->4)-alpha-D-glucan 1-alpha-D-glucosylmutase
MLDWHASKTFIESFDQFARRAALIGALKSLVQVTWKTTMPGIPDFYQGTELWDLSLVDPDNRRAVDFAARRSQIKSLEQSDWLKLAESRLDGRIKFALTARLLGLRRQFSELFTNGRYEPIDLGGPHRDEVVAFARINGNDAVIVVAPKLFGRATEGGRQWPKRDAWRVSVATSGRFTGMRDLLGSGSEIGERSTELTAYFNVLPVGVAHAQYIKRPARTNKVRSASMAV